MIARKAMLNFRGHLLNVLASILMMGFITSSATADDYMMSGIRHLDETDIAGISGPVTFDELIEKFGNSTRSDSYAIGWPKKEHEHLSNEEKWKRGYWFFYKRKNNGRPERPISLEYVAALPDDVEIESQAWLGLVHYMRVVWPLESKGDLLLDIYR